MLAQGSITFPSDHFSLPWRVFWDIFIRWLSRLTVSFCGVDILHPFYAGILTQYLVTLYIFQDLFNSIPPRWNQDLLLGLITHSSFWCLADHTFAKQIPFSPTNMYWMLILDWVWGKHSAPSVSSQSHEHIYNSNQSSLLGGTWKRDKIEGVPRRKTSLWINYWEKLHKTRGIWNRPCKAVGFRQHIMRGQPKS